MEIALGAKVIATAGSEEKLQVCTKYGGADHAINYKKEGWQKEVLKLTSGKGVGESYLSIHDFPWISHTHRSAQM